MTDDGGGENTQHPLSNPSSSGKSSSPLALESVSAKQQQPVVLTPSNKYDRRPYGTVEDIAAGHDRDDEEEAPLSQPLLGTDLVSPPPVSRSSLRAWDLKPRTVSNDDDPNIVGTAELTSLPSPNQRIRREDTRTSSLTIDSLRSMTPFETEAELYILSALDETDPTNPILVVPGIAPLTHQQSLFDESGHNDSHGGRATDGTTAPRLPLFKNSSGIEYHQKPISTAEELYHLTLSMLKLDQLTPRAAATAVASNDNGRRNSLGANGMNILKYGHVLQPKRDNNNPDEESQDNKLPLNDRMTYLKDLAHLSSRRGASAQQTITRAIVSEYQTFHDWFRLKRLGIRTTFKYALIFSILPGTAVASILFYWAGNPPCNRELQCSPRTTDDPTLDWLGSASASWWILFICCRQVITLIMAWAVEDVVVDYLALRTNWGVRLCGPLLTLFIIQAKGWPCVVFFWGVLDLLLLFGRHPFAQHWLFYQDFLLLMNGENPSGLIPNSSRYRFIVLAAMCVSLAAAIKRVWLGIVLGRVTYQRYSDELARVMSRAVLLGKVATLAREIERSNLEFGAFDLPSYDLDKDGPAECSRSTEKSDLSKGNIFVGLDDNIRKAKIDELLGEWDEPEAQRAVEERPSIASVIQFRQSTAYLNTPLPFGAAFGNALTRQDVVDGAEALYNRLLRSVPDRNILTFDVLALLAVKSDDDLDVAMLRSLIKLFRPERNGDLGLLEFVKSIDTCYKEIRLLRANIRNSSQMDQSFERIVNFAFYIAVTFVLLGVIGVNPRILFASITSFIVSLKFMIGTGCTAYFEGIVMVFCQRPYDIGDRIATSYPYLDTSTTGSMDWVVKDMNLYSTTVIYGSTNEVATHANGALSILRIVNATRSPQASLSFHLKFAIETPHAKIQLFRSAIEKFIRARPREWVRFSMFRVYAVEASSGYVDYSVGAIHRESWNNSAVLSNSKADLQAFANELAKKMNMRYIAPPKPITANLKSSDSSLGPGTTSFQGEATNQYSGVETGAIAHHVAAIFNTTLSP